MSGKLLAPLSTDLHPNGAPPDVRRQGDAMGKFRTILSNHSRVRWETIEAFGDRNGSLLISEARSSEAHRIPEKSRCMLLAVFAPEEHELRRASQPIQLAILKCLISSILEKTSLHSWRSS